MMKLFSYFIYKSSIGKYHFNSEIFVYPGKTLFANYIIGKWGGTLLNNSYVMI